MSAASPPRAATEPAVEPAPATSASLTPAATDEDGWALLDGLRRRLEDQAAQTRRTQQQVTQLAESIGALVEAQRRRARWLNLNSFIAYLIFTTLCGAGFFALYHTRAGALVAARQEAEHQRELAARRADEALARVAARERAEASAWEVYRLLEAGQRREAVAQLAGLAAAPLSRTERAVLAARSHETQVLAIDAALRAAAAALKAGRHADVIAPLEAALVSDPAGARAPQLRYYLGVAHAKAGHLARAVEHLQAAVETGADAEDARFQLASALDRGGAYARARAEYDRFATAHPQSPLAVFAMRRSATLARLPPVAPGAALVAPVVPRPAPGPPAPPAPSPAAAGSAAAPAAAGSAAARPWAPVPAAPRAVTGDPPPGAPPPPARVPPATRAPLAPGTGAPIDGEAAPAPGAPEGS